MKHIRKRFFCTFLSFFLIFLFFLTSGFAKPCNLDYGHAEDTPLYFGNPTDATDGNLTTDLELDATDDYPLDINAQNDDNYLMQKKHYTLSYNRSKLIPNWVGWHLCASDLGEADRSNKFAADKSLPQGWYAVKKNDYQYSAYGYDRGHVCPSADRTASREANEETFLMTNMIPQAPDCNRIVWKQLEDYERELAQQGLELYIFAGPAQCGAVGERGYFENIAIAPLAISVPKYCWKVILSFPEGENDLERIKENPDLVQLICVCMPNEQGVQKQGGWQQFECTLEEVEELAGVELFELWRTE